MRKRKNRKTGLTVILLILIFSVSIGYASLSTQVNVSGNATIRYESDSITVTFDANGGTIGTNNKSVQKGAQYGELPTPTREGYTFMGWSKLPTEYQEVEYIESTGSQYILTDITPNDNMGVYIRVASKDVDSDNIYVGSSGSSSSRFYIDNTSGKLYFGWNSNTPSSLRPTINADTVFSAKLNYLNSRTNMYNDITVENITESLGANTRGIAIFAANYSGSIDYKSKIKLYELKISENEDIIHDFIPCYRKEDNEIGLYDLNENRFYSNQGSGTFSKGEDTDNYIESTDYVTTQKDHTLYAVWKKDITVTFNANGGTVNTSTKNVTSGSQYGELPTPTKEGYTFMGWSKVQNLSYHLPTEYQEVEYIESTGSQYILTDITPNDNMGAYIKVASKDVDSDNIYVGSKDSNASRFYIDNTSGKLYFGWNTNTPTELRQTINADTVFSAKLNYLNSRTNMYNDITVENITESLESNTRGIAIFAANYEGTIDYKSKIKLYELKISENENIIHDFVPCYRKEDNEIGLYNLNENRFYSNQGSGTFTKGEDIDYYVESTDYVITEEDHTLYAIWEENE